MNDLLTATSDQSVIFRQLPPGPEPKKLTAHALPRSLHEHFLAFLNYNNKRGFASFENEESVQEATPLAFTFDSGSIDMETIAGLMLTLATQESINYFEFKAMARKITESTKRRPGVRRIGLGHVNEILARMLGYKSHSSMIYYAGLMGLSHKEKLIRCKRASGVIKNRRDLSTIRLAEYEQWLNKQHKK